MVRVQSFVAVNESHQADTAEQQATQESRESNVIGLYERALRSVQKKDAEDAKACFRAVLDDPLVQAPTSQQMQRIRFLSLKNLGGILAEAGGSAAAALECYVSACELDGTDVVLWNRLGTLASEAGSWALARHAFERGLQYSPSHPTMRAKLQLLLRHVGAADGAASARGAAAGAVKQQGGTAQALPAATAGLLHLQPLSTALAEPLTAPEMATWPKSVKVTEPSWPALLNSIAFLCSDKQPRPLRVQLRLPAEGRPGAGKAAVTAGAAIAAAAVAGALIDSAEQLAGVGSSAVIVEEVVRLQLTPGKRQKLLSAVQPDKGGPSPPLAAVEPAIAQAAAETGTATPLPATEVQQVTEQPLGEEEHVAVELLIQPVPAVLGTIEMHSEPGNVVPTPQPGHPAAGGEGGLYAAAAAAGETPAAAVRREQGMPVTGLGTRNGSISRSGRKRRSRRGQQAEQEPGAPMASAQGSLLSLLDLLGLLDPILEGQRQHTLQEGAGCPAEASDEGVLPGGQGEGGGKKEAAGEGAEASASGGSGLAEAAVSAEPQQAQLQTLAAAAPAVPTGAASAAHVRAYIRSLPEAGLHPSQLLLGLVRQLAGSTEALAALSASERGLLLKAADQVYLDGQSSILPAECCLVLAELCISEAAAALVVAAPLASSRGAGSEAAAGNPSRGQAGRLALERKDSGRGRSSKVARSTSPAQLRQQAEQWLLRHMAATVAAALDGAGDALQLPEQMLGTVAAPAVLEALPADLAGPADSRAPLDVAIADAVAEESSPQSAGVANGEATTAGMAVRYWWARGQLEEAKGAASEAAQFYQRCLQALEDWGLQAVNVPHWRQLPPEGGKPAGPLAITAAALRSKLEVLRMHDIVAEADLLAQQAQHEAVADSLAAFLLPWKSKEDSMSVLDVQRWQHALARLHEAALASGRPWLAAAAQLRMMWHALARLPVGLELGKSSVAGPGAEAALATALRGPLTSHSLAVMDIATVLEASVHFFGSYRSQLFQRDGGGLASNEADRTWSEWEWLLLRRAQRRLLGLIEGCRLVLAGDTRSGHLSLNASSQHRAMTAAAALVVHLWTLDPAPEHSPRATVALVRPLCEALAQGHTLMEAEGAFVLLCLRHLREAHDALIEQYGKDVLGKEEDEEVGSEDEPEELSDARDLCWDVTVGIHNCLHWLYGIDLVGREDEPWAEGFEAPHLAGRLLSSPQACVEVWPLVSEYLLEMDGKELQAFTGFINLVAAHFPQPPSAALHRLEAAWGHLAAAELPDDFLASNIMNPLEVHWRPTREQGSAEEPLGAPPAEGVAAGAGAWTSEGTAFMASEGAPAVQGSQGLAGADVLKAGGVQPMDIDEGAAQVVAAAAADIERKAQVGVALEAAAAAAAAAAGQQQEDEQEQLQPHEQLDREDDGYRQVRSSLYRLLALQHSDLEEALAGKSLLASEAEAALERMLAPCKYDLLYNPTSFVAWEQLAASYHEAADWMLEEAVKAVTPQDWNSQQYAAVRERARRYSHLGYHCTAMALKYVDKEDGAEDETAKLLAISGDRLYSDQQRVPPGFSKLLNQPFPLEAAQQRRQGYGRAFRALQQASALRPDDWELVLGQAKCLQKVGHPPFTWLPQLARACHLASAMRAGAPVDAVYALHAARLKLLLTLRSGLEGNSPAGQPQPSNPPATAADVIAPGRESWDGQQLVQVVQLVGRYCFTRQAQQQLGFHNASVSSQPEAVMEEQQQQTTEGSSQDATAGAPVEESAAAAVVSKALEPQQMLRCLIEDCLEAMRWCLQRDRLFHRAAYRLAEGRLALEGRLAAIQELAPLFSKPPKQPFCISITRIEAGDAVEAAAGPKRRKGTRGRKAQQEPAHDGQQGEVAERDWGICPARASGAAREESLQQYYGSVRKYLRRYLQLLAEEGQLNQLRMAGGYLSTNGMWGPAALPAFSDVRQLASGQLVLCMLRSMGHICPPARLLSALDAGAAPGPDAGGPAAIDGMSSQALPSDPEGLSVPAKPCGWEQLRAELQDVLQQMEGRDIEALLETLHQFKVEHSLLPREEGQGWEQAVLGPTQLALSSSKRELQSSMSEELPELASSNDLFRAYAELYVLLLGRQNKLEQLLEVAKKLRLRAKGAVQQQLPQQQSQPSRELGTHLELIFQQALAALRQSTSRLHEAAGKVRPELITCPSLQPASAAQSADAGPLLQPQPAPQDGQDAPTGPAASPTGQAVPGSPQKQDEAMQDAAAVPEVELLGQHPTASAVPMLQQLLYAPFSASIPTQLQQQLALALLQQQMALQVQAQMQLQRQQWSPVQGVQEQTVLPPATRLGTPSGVQGPAPSQAVSSLASRLYAAVQQGQLSSEEAMQHLQQLLQQEQQLHQQRPHPQPPALPLTAPFPQQVVPPQGIEVAHSAPALPEQQPLATASMGSPDVPALLVGHMLVPAGSSPWGQPTGLVALTGGPPAMGQQPLPLVHTGPAAQQVRQGSPARSPAAAPAKEVGSPRPAAVAGDPAPVATMTAKEPLGQSSAALHAAAATVAEAAAAQADPHAAPATPCDKSAIEEWGVGGAAAAGGAAEVAALVEPPSPTSGVVGAAMPGLVPEAAELPGPPPLTVEESELVDRAVELLRAGKELHRLVNLTAQGMAYGVKGHMPLLRSVEELLASLYRTFAALARRPGPPAKVTQLLKACDEVAREHRRLSQRGTATGGAAAAAAALEAAGGLDCQAGVADGSEGDGPKAGARRRGRPPRAGSRELSLAAEERQGPGSVAAGASGVAVVQGSARKRTRRDVLLSASASPQPKQQVPVPLDGRPEGLLLSPGGACQNHIPAGGGASDEPGAVATELEAAGPGGTGAADITTTNADATTAAAMAASEGAAAAEDQAPAADEPRDAGAKKRGMPEPEETEGQGEEPVREAKRQRSGDGASNGQQPEIVGSGMAELPVDTTAEMEPGGQGDIAVPEPIESAMVEPSLEQLGPPKSG